MICGEISGKFVRRDRMYWRSKGENRFCLPCLPPIEEEYLN